MYMHNIYIYIYTHMSPRKENISTSRVRAAYHRMSDASLMILLLWDGNMILMN